MNPASRINKYLAAKGSPLAGKGAVFVREARRNGLDPFLLVAIAGAESDFGKYGPTAKIHNPFGWGPHIKFASWDQAISTVARGLRKGYLDEGRKTISAIGAKWAPQGASNDPTNLNSNWARNVGRFYAEIGGKGISAKPARATQGASPALPAAQPPPVLSAPDFSGLALQNVSAIAGGGKAPSPLEMLSGLTSAVASQPPPDLTGSIPNFGGLAPEPDTPAGAKPGTFTIAAGANREGVGLQPAVTSFVAKIAGIYGQPLTIGTGTNHNQFVKGTRRESAHWAGYGADIPSSGAALTRLGQAALIAAGADPAWARKQKGGLFNIGGHQVIFNTHTGGNHYDHLHVGVRR